MVAAGRAGRSTRATGSARSFAHSVTLSAGPAAPTSCTRAGETWARETGQSAAAPPTCRISRYRILREAITQYWATRSRAIASSRLAHESRSAAIGGRLQEAVDVG